MTELRRWEYRWTSVYPGAKEKNEPLRELPALGRDGWEAVGIAQHTTSSAWVLLKRPLADDL